MKKLILSVILVVLIAGLIFLPHRLWLENRLEDILEAKGFENVELTIASIGFKSAAIENVSIGGENKLNLKNIVLGYSWRDLWNRNLRELTVGGVTLDVRQNEGRWVITGLEGWSAKPESNVSEPFAFPITAEELARVPFERMKIEESQININLEKAKFSLPLNVEWQKSPKSQLIYKGEDISFAANNFEITAGSLTLDAYIDEGSTKWEGPWALNAINIKGAAMEVPPLNAAGTVLSDKTHAEIKGAVTSGDKLWQADFIMNYNFTTPDQSALTITQASLPWKEGRIETRDVKVPLTGQEPIKATLQIHSVSMQELMQSLTGDKVTATGKVSGTLPLIIGRDGKITVLQGDLKSEEPGQISMPADLIPGDNEQIQLVRQILEDLQYTNLSIKVQNDNAGKLGILMTFEGNNPAVYEGKPVKLNVNLTGDVLEFIQQNLLLLTNPEQLLQQGNDEKN